MKKNYVFAFVLSMAVLVLWDTLVLRPQRRAASQAETLTPPLPAASPAPSAPLPAPATLREKNIVYEVGDNRITFNLMGAAVAQWEILEGGRWVPLVPSQVGAAQPLATFPGLEHTAQREGNEIRFTARREDGLTVEKTFSIDPAGHKHRLALSLANAGKAPVSADHEIGWGPGVLASDDPSATGKNAAKTQRALALENSRLHHFKKPSLQSGTYRWWAVDGHYFLAAFFNETGDSVSLRVDRDDPFYALHRPVALTLEPGQSKDTAVSFYLGPKKYADLAALGVGLERAVDFGFFASLGKIIYRSLLFFHSLTHNFGWAIILLTLIIQVLVSPLTITSFKHSQKMKAVQPQLKRIQELYKNDPKRMNVEMLALYQRHGMRFMGLEGCLPMLIQLPVFWALFSTLSSVIELRHAPWIGWVKDLSVHDPFYVLPVLMAVGMFLQQKLSAVALDPSQRQIMYIMPVIFLFFMIKMPAGLVLYWFTSSMISAALQFFLLQRQKSLEAAS